MSLFTYVQLNVHRPILIYSRCQSIRFEGILPFFQGFPQRFLDAPTINLSNNVSCSLITPFVCTSFIKDVIRHSSHLNRTNSSMFAAFRRRAASATRSESSIKEGPLLDSNGRKANAENQGFATPTLPTNGNGLKHRTLSGLSVSSSSSLSTSPMLNITRQQEKHELQTLNDRLAVIIDTVRRLEQDNEKLRVRTKKNNADNMSVSLWPCRIW